MSEAMPQSYSIDPIGVVRKNDDGVQIEIFKNYADGLLGLEGFSHIFVFYWFHQNDTPEKRKTLRVHPRKDPQNPLTGVFATHSPRRPNPIAQTLCKIVAITDHIIEIEEKNRKCREIAEKDLAALAARKRDRAKHSELPICLLASVICLLI